MTTTVLQGRTIVVTGASIGLGRAMALALAEAGANVAALDLPGSQGAADALLRAAGQMGCAGTILPVFADVTDEAAVEAALAAAEHRFGALYGLVNNAAIGMQDIGPVQIPPRKPFYEVPVETWRRVIDTNLNGPFTVSRCIAPRLIAARRGSIANLVTSFRTMHNQGFSPYGPTKAALETATAIWAKDLAGTGVIVNALLPGGAANTRMIPEAEIPDRSTLVQPEAMGPPVVWLMSDEAIGVTGQRIVARDWDAALPLADVMRKAVSPAGYGG